MNAPLFSPTNLGRYKKSPHTLAYGGNVLSPLLQSRPQSCSTYSEIPPSQIIFQ